MVVANHASRASTSATLRAATLASRAAASLAYTHAQQQVFTKREIQPDRFVRLVWEGTVGTIDT